MSAATYLICDSYEHAEVCDGIVCESLRDADGNRGARWSGVYTNGTQFGIVWAPEVAAVFGEEALVIEDVDGEWTEVLPPEPEPQGLP